MNGFYIGRQKVEPAVDVDLTRVGEVTMERRLGIADRRQKERRFDVKPRTPSAFAPLDQLELKK